MYHKLISFIVVLSLLLFSCSTATDQSDSSSQSNTDYIKELHEIAEQINKKCPQFIDSETRLDGVDILETNTVVYKYTLVHIVAATFDTLRFKKEMWPGLLSNIKISRDMQKFRDHQTSAYYYYADKSNLPICTIKIQASDYNKK